MNQDKLQIIIIVQLSAIIVLLFAFVIMFSSEQKRMNKTEIVLDHISQNTLETRVNTDYTFRTLNERLR